MAIRIFPIIIAGGTGVVRGLARRNDVAQGRANPDGSALPGKFPLAMVIDVAALGGGVALDLMRFTPDISEPLILAGSALLGDRGGHAISAQIMAPQYASPYYAAAAAAVPAAEAAPAGRRSAFSYV